LIPGRTPVKRFDHRPDFFDQNPEHLPKGIKPEIELEGLRV
jgi:hypothetical protein